MNPVPKAIRVLIAEDNPNDAELVIRALRKGGFEPDWRRVETEADFIAALEDPVDLVISDYEMPEFGGLRALAILKEKDIGIPFILVSGTIGEETAVTAMKMGASDYLLKDRLGRLGAAVDHELENRQLREESRRAQQQLHRREEHFRSLIENSSDLITVLNEAGVIRFQSPSSERILGYRPAELTGRNALEFIHPDDVARVTAALQRAHHLDGAEVSEDFRFRHHDGGWRLVQSIGRSLPGEAAERQVVLNSRDVTESKNMEHQLRHAQKMEAIGQLAGGIAHDFNNILGSILGNAEHLRLLPAIGPETSECLDDIFIASRRAADLVGQILAFSRQQESTRQPLELPPVVREVLKLLRATVPAHVEFRAQLASVPAVLADPTELHSVIMNLCTNAWHALRGRSGLITVGLEEVEPDQDFIRQHPDLRSGRYVRLTVADDGCGMDEATLGRIFEPFFTTKAVGEGTGLGLAVVHGIVRSYDGCIVVQSQPGVGTSFQLYFPVFAAEAPAAAPPPPTAPRGGGEHILFVDDEEPLARLGTRMLERLGYRVTPHTDPAEALAVFRARPTDFDLVVVDYNMPGLNGTEFGAQVLEVRPVQRIILATGYSANLTPEAARDLGFRELMPKPYDLNRLGETVHRALHGDDLRP